MNKQNRLLHLFGILIILFVTFVTINITGQSGVLADDDYCDNGAVNPPACDTCSLTQEMVGGRCRNYCAANQTRNPEGDCVDNECPNNAINPPFCSSCSEDQEMYEGYCVYKCTGGQSRSQSGNCVCPSGQELVGGVCMAVCTGGQTRSGTGACECPVGFELEGGFCVTICTGGQTRNSTSGLCECPTGQELVGATCMAVCSSNTTRDPISTLCVCTNGADDPPGCLNFCSETQACNYNRPGVCNYDCKPACCDVQNALNYDPACPVLGTTRKDNTSCRFCTSSSQESRCIINACSILRANNYQSESDCEAANVNMNCVASENPCTFDEIHYCTDNTALFPPSVTYQQCFSNKVDPRQNCTADDSACSYGSYYYCDNNLATNRDPGGMNCRIAHPKGTCIADYNTSNDPNSVCQYNMCNVNFSLDITCPSGAHYSALDYSYWYIMGANDVCSNPSASELNYLSSYFEQRVCAGNDTAVCTGDYCGNVDWCPAEGTQTDPTMCADMCPNEILFPGIQPFSSSGYACGATDVCPLIPDVQTSLSQCTQVVTGICGTKNGQSAESGSLITGTAACISGTKYPSTLVPSNNQFSWQCQGSGGGNTASCSASLACPAGTQPCGNNVCLAQCNVVTCINQLICPAFDGNIDLRKLTVTPPVINLGDSCVIDWSSGVFDSYNNDTHCILSKGSTVLKTFDPATATSADLSYTENNVKNDTVYTLKCYDGALPTDPADFETVTGSCRLNLKTTEYN